MMKGCRVRHIVSGTTGTVVGSTEEVLFVVRDDHPGVIAAAWRKQDVEVVVWARPAPFTEKEMES